jgi:hypothetical protein
MSTIGGGGAAPSSYDSLSALVDFIKSPDSQARVKELRDLEASSKAATEVANKSMADAQSMSDDLDAKIAKHTAAAAKLKADQEAHAARVDKINKAIDALKAALG